MPLPRQPAGQRLGAFVALGDGIEMRPFRVNPRYSNAGEAKSGDEQQDRGAHGLKAVLRHGLKAVLRHSLKANAPSFLIRLSH